MTNHTARPNEIFSFANIRIQLTDADGGTGYLSLELLDNRRYVQDPRPANYPYSHYHGGHYEADHYRVVGTASPNAYPNEYGLKLYPAGFVFPSSIDGATQFSTVEEANEMVAKWLAAGGQGVALEHPDETKRKRREAQSNYAYGKASHWLGQLTDADLLRLAETCTNYATVRAEAAAKAAAKVEARRLKALEKAAKAAAKIAEKAAKAEAKVAAAAAKALKVAEKEAKAAEKAAKKAPAVVQDTTAPV